MHRPLALRPGRYLATALIVLLAFGVGFSLKESGIQLSAPGQRVEAGGNGEQPAPEHDRPVVGLPGVPSPAGAPSTVSFDELLRAAGRVAALRASLDELSPPDSDWPDDVPDDLQPERFVGHVEDALEFVGAGELEAMDCAEYPCVATLLIPEDQEGVSQAQGLMKLMEVRKELETYLDLPIDAHFDTHPSGARLTLSARPEDVGNLRLRQRLEEAWTAASQ